MIEQPRFLQKEGLQKEGLQKEGLQKEGLQKEGLQKKVASLRPMRQLSGMLRPLIWTLAIILSGCSLPAPYQTYSPGTAPLPVVPPTNPLIVYGGTTTTSDMATDAPGPQPFSPIDTAMAPMPTPSSSTPMVAICYNRLWNKPDAIKTAASQACGKSPARIVSQGTDLDACPLLTPTKAVFACGASSSP